jgi:hypothetical protein
MTVKRRYLIVSGAVLALAGGGAGAANADPDGPGADARPQKSQKPAAGDSGRNAPSPGAAAREGGREPGP